MKIAISQLNYIIGDFEGNYRKITQAIDQAVNQGADLVLFSEFSVCGSPVGDLLLYTDFVQNSMKIVQRIAVYAKDRVAVVVGSPTASDDYKALYNSGIFLNNGQIQNVVHKTSFSKQDYFEENRYFERLKQSIVFEHKGYRIAMTIGDAYADQLEDLSSESFDIILNLTASSFAMGKTQVRRAQLKSYSATYQAAFFSCNQVGGHGDIIFDGGSLVGNASGVLVDELDFFKSAVRIFDVGEVNNYSAGDQIQEDEDIALVHRALVVGIKDYFEKSGFKKAILGLSGGVDSALVVALAAQALGSENVFSVLMPSQYSSDHSVSDALELVGNLGSPHAIVPIEEAYYIFENSLQSHFKGLPADVTEENLQARIRGLYLMAFSNKWGHLLLNSTNKSEAAIGYGTLYGDMNGAIGVIGDLYKTQVYELCRYINRDGEIIPSNILTKAPSAELRPDQKDSDSLPEYDILDDILYRFIEQHECQQEIIDAGHDSAVVQRVVRLVQRGEFKRRQTPPYLKVSSKSLGQIRSLPVVAKF